MSWEATTWALTEAPTEVTAEVMVLVGLANHAHADGRNAWISNARLADYVRCSVRSVQTHLASLEAKGIIRRGDQEAIPSRIPANRRPVVWDLAMELTRSGVQNLHPKMSRGAESDAQGCKKPGSGVKPVADKLNTNQEINQGASRVELSTGGFPPSPAALRAAELEACEHGAPPGRCALCRRAGHDG